MVNGTSGSTAGGTSGTGGGASGGGIGGQTTSSQTTTVVLKTAIWDDVKKTLDSMVSIKGRCVTSCPFVGDHLVPTTPMFSAGFAVMSNETST